MFPKNLFDKYLTRFDELIERGEKLLFVVQRKKANNIDIENDDVTNDCIQWLINYRTLLNNIINIYQNSIHKTLLTPKGTIWGIDVETELRADINILIGLKEDLEQGFLGNLSLQIESEISADYMGQAEQLLREGQTGQYDHVPAAVLCGAVLEKALRTLCENQNPPISTIKNDGTSKTLNPLIDDLKKAGLFNELKAKQLRAWADIRNKAAHGEFDQFSRSDVEMMIKGVEDFLANYMT